jgi:L-cysteine/cystine lyase
MVAPFMPDQERLAAVRAALPALAAGIYLNTGSVGPLPVEVAAAMADASARELAQGRAHMDDWLDFQERLAEARAAVAALLTTDPSAIALTHSTTDSINAIVLALGLGPGDHIVTTNAEHAGVLGPVFAARALGVGVEIADIGDGGDDARTLAAIEAAMTPATRVVLASHVLWTTGAVLPVARIAALAHDREAVLVVDGAQSAGAIRIDLEATGADAYAIAAQKWLLGPEGMGALAVRPWLVERLTPALAGHFSFEKLVPDGTAVFHPNGRRFEWSGMHRPSVVGMARAISWLQMFVGLDWIHSRGQAMARGAADRLAAIPGVSVLTPTHQMATLVTFRIAGWPAAAALAELGARAFVIARTIDSLDALRISVGFFTSDEELDRFAEAVSLLAAHTPESIPARRTLTILGND